MKILPVLLSVLCFTLFLSGCRKCENDQIDPAFDLYISGFKEGSYWIYQNEQNGERDSVYVIKREVYSEAARSKSFQRECFTRDITLFMAGFSFADTVKTFVPSSINILALSTPVKHQADISQFYHRNVQLNPASMRLMDGTTYPEVVQIDSQSDTTSVKTSGLSQLWYAKSIGLIRWQCTRHPKYGNATYSLVKYKVL